MVRVVSFTLLAAALSIVAHGQTTLSNLDDNAINPANTPNPPVVLREWQFSTGSGVGCSSTPCPASGNVSHTTTSPYTVDGQSLQLNLINAVSQTTGKQCSSNCYNDVIFSDQLYQGSTASAATKFTLDMQAWMNSVGNANSQALEYTIEQDVPSTEAGQASNKDRYIYSMQCDYKNTGIWNYWDGEQYSANLSNHVVGQSQPGLSPWKPAVDSNTHATISCDKFSTSGFTHFYFHFQRNPSSRTVTYVDFTLVPANGSSIYHPLNITSPIQTSQAYGEGLSTMLQLDGDYAEDPYSAWGDKWTVAYQ